MSTVPLQRADVEGVTLLVIGNYDNPSLCPVIDAEKIHFADYFGVDAALLTRIDPGVIISGLFGTGFDALDVAQLLQGLAFSGRYRVIAERLPKPGLVRTEVRYVAPDIDFDIINLRPGSADLI